MPLPLPLRLRGVASLEADLALETLKWEEAPEDLAAPRIRTRRSVMARGVGFSKLSAVEGSVFFFFLFFWGGWCGDWERLVRTPGGRDSFYIGVNV